MRLSSLFFIFHCIIHLKVHVVVYSSQAQAIKGARVQRGVCLLLCALLAYSRKSSNNSIKNQRLIAIKKGTQQAIQAVTFKEQNSEAETARE